MDTNHRFYRAMTPLMIFSVVAWLIFILFFRTFWPGSSTPGDSMGVFWAWYVIGGVIFMGMTFGIFRWLQIPREWYPAAGIAAFAPAFFLDTFSTMFFEVWFPNAGSGDDRVYPAMILGVGGLILLSILFTSAPSADA